MKRLILIAAALLAIQVAASAADPQLVFEDKFEGKLGDGWKWLRENPKAWRIRDGALEICVEPGLAGNVKNALVRPAPDRRKGKFAVEVTVSNLTKPTQQYEQGGITLYQDGKPVFKLVKERIDGGIYIIPGKVPLETNAVQLRVVLTPEEVISQFRPEGKGEFRTVETRKLAKTGKEEVSIQCYNGPKDAEHWIGFDDFRILRIGD